MTKRNRVCILVIHLSSPSLFVHWLIKKKEPSVLKKKLNKIKKFKKKKKKNWIESPRFFPALMISDFMTSSLG